MALDLTLTGRELQSSKVRNAANLVLTELSTPHPSLAVTPDQHPESPRLISSSPKITPSSHIDDFQFLFKASHLLHCQGRKPAALSSSSASSRGPSAARPCCLPRTPGGGNPRGVAEQSSKAPEQRFSQFWGNMDNGHDEALPKLICMISHLQSSFPPVQ